MNDILQRAKSFISSEPFVPSAPNRTNFTLLSTHDDALAHYKDRYIQAMEERLYLHRVLSDKSTELTQKKELVTQILEYIVKLEANVENSLSVSVPKFYLKPIDHGSVSGVSKNMTAWIDLIDVSTATDHVHVHPFLKENHIPEMLVDSTVLHGVKAFGIPVAFVDKFKEYFLRAVQKSARNSSSGKTNSMIPWKELISSYSWNAAQEMKANPLFATSLESGVIEFLNSRLPVLGLSLESVKVNKVISIPISLKKEFKKWFVHRYNHQFQDLNSDNESCRKRKLQSESEYMDSTQQESLNVGFSQESSSIPKSGLKRYNV
jgi:hypothetical protein